MAAAACIAALVVLSTARVAERPVAASASAVALLATTGNEAVSEPDLVLTRISLGDVTIASSDGDTRMLKAGRTGAVSVEPGPDYVTLSSISVPPDWLLYFEVEGAAGTLRLTAKPLAQAKPAGRVALSLLLPAGAVVRLDAAEGGGLSPRLDRLTQVELRTSALDLSLKLKEADADVFAALPVRALSLQRIVRRFEPTSGQDRESLLGSVRQGQLWIADDGQSPRPLTPIDRVRLGGLREAAANLRVGDRLIEVTMRGRASEISNSLGDVATDLRPSWLDVLARDELLKLLFALLAFVAGLEITWGRRR